MTLLTTWPKNTITIATLSVSNLLLRKAQLLFSIGEEQGFLFLLCHIKLCKNALFSWETQVQHTLCTMKLFCLRGWLHGKISSRQTGLKKSPITWNISARVEIEIGSKLRQQFVGSYCCFGNLHLPTPVNHLFSPGWNFVCNYLGFFSPGSSNRAEVSPSTRNWVRVEGETSSVDVEFMNCCNLKNVVQFRGTVSKI